MNRVVKHLAGIMEVWAPCLMSGKWVKLSLAWSNIRSHSLWYEILIILSNYSKDPLWTKTYNKAKITPRVTVVFSVSTISFNLFSGSLSTRWPLLFLNRRCVSWCLLTTFCIIFNLGNVYFPAVPWFLLQILSYKAASTLCFTPVIHLLLYTMNKQRLCNIES